MTRLRLAIAGWGRLGKACAAALRGAPEMALAGIVRRAASLGAPAPGIGPGVPAVAHVRDLGAVDAVLVCVAAEVAADTVQELLQMRLPIVECASLDGHALDDHHARIAHLCARHRTRAVVGAGWDCGVLPQLRHLFELLIPKGQTRVGSHLAPGLHHAAAVEGLPGVQGALSSEVGDPAGGRRRYVYVQLARGADEERVRRQIEGDPLYADEPTEVLPVPDLAALEADDHGVLVERLEDGPAGPHASLLLEARFDGAAFSARLMLDAARAQAALPQRGWRYTPFGLVPLAEEAAGTDAGLPARRRER